MSNIHDLSVGELIQILQSTYCGIDFRAALIKEKKEWDCIFSILRTSIQDKRKIESLHENKRSLIRSKPPDVQFVYEFRNVADINSILSQINNGQTEIGTYKAKIENAEHKEIDKKKTQTVNSYSISEDVGFPHKVLIVPYGDSGINPLKRLENHGIKASDFGLTWIQDIKSCFDVGNMYDPYYLILVFPVYAKILECLPDKAEKKLLSKFQIHDMLFSKSKLRLEVRSPLDHRLIENRVIEPPFHDVIKDANGMATISISVDISSLKPGNSGTIKIEHEKLGEVAFENFNIRAQAGPPDFSNMDINELVSNELLPLDENPFQLINLLKEAGIEYNSSTKEFKITGDDHTLVLPLRKENLIKLEFGDLFYDMLKKEINSGYKFGLYSGVAVLSRKLIENLLIDILRKKYPRSQKGNLELYYDKNRRRFHDFAILIENLEKRKREFEIDEPTVSKFLSFAKPFRPSTNSSAHSIIHVSNEDKIMGYKIPEMIALLLRLKHLAT